MYGKTGFLKRASQGRPKEKYLMVFVVAFVGMMVSFVPSMIVNKGIFLYYGDFNSQQMMFYYHANEAVKNGAMGWDWGTDLGANFVGSYSFYLLGSPFFWLSTLFPLKAVPYLMPWLLALKTAVAALTAYAYIRRFVKNPNACFVGSMLYAFSGFQIYNVFFNHFHDATAFFPLLLLGLELLTQDGKKGAFAIPVAICASISYFFFVCEVVFTIIYFVIRCMDKSFRMNIKIFGLLALESVLGVMVSACILLPAVIDVVTNPRVTSYLFGLDMVFYSENVRIPRIIQSFFMLPDMPARVNILTSDKARWASMAGYLPMFSMCGVIAFMRTRKKHWMSRMILVCAVMACVPVLNASYVLFNSSYYARWYYMPILIMCLMTAKLIEENREDLKKGFVPVAVICSIFLLIGCLPKKEKDKIVFGEVPKYIELYWIQAIVTILMTVMLFFIIYQLGKKRWYRVVNFMTAAACIICMTSSVIYGVAQGDDNADYIDRAINGADNLDMAKLDGDTSGSQNNFYRIDTSENVDNWCMFWGLSSMRTFHSVVPTSIMDFYTSIGQQRDVASRMDTNLYPLRGLFSVKYYFKELTDEQIRGKKENKPSEYVQNLEGFKFVDTQNGFNIYENEYFIPMGFTYDYYTTNEEVEYATEVHKTQLLLKALVLDDRQAKKYSDILQKYTYDFSDMNTESYKELCMQKRSESCYYFKEDTNGFDAKIKLDDPKLVFFSVPYEKGWTAEINGEPAEIEKVSYGFMAVKCPSGDNTITFRYKTAGLAEGRIITFVGAGILIAYIAVGYALRKKAAAKPSEAEAANAENNSQDN
ncbi:MAG: YfhO family protein [Oscillospiraceae bacterium]